MDRRSRKALETLTTSPSVREAAATLINAIREESLARIVTSEAYERAVERLGRVRGRSLQLPLFSGGVGNGARIVLTGAQNLVARRLTKFHRGLAKSGLSRHMALSDWSIPEVRQASLLDSPSEDANVPACMVKYAESFEGQGEMNLHSHLLIHTFLAAHNFL